jgi:hypothetical protein
MNCAKALFAGATLVTATRAGFEVVAVFTVGAGFLTACDVVVRAAAAVVGTGRCSNVARAFGWVSLQDS